MNKYVNAAEAADKISKKLNIPMNKLVDIFAEIPRADVKKDKKGKWIGDIDGGTYCSICGWYADYDYEYVRNNGLGNPDFFFCGHCGAKMNGGNDE